MNGPYYNCDIWYVCTRVRFMRCLIGPRYLLRDKKPAFVLAKKNLAIMPGGAGAIPQLSQFNGLVNTACSLSRTCLTTRLLYRDRDLGLHAKLSGLDSKFSFWEKPSSEWFELFAVGLFWVPNNDWRPLKNDGLLEKLRNGEKGLAWRHLFRGKGESRAKILTAEKHSVRQGIKVALWRISLAPSSIKPIALNPFFLSSSPTVSSSITLSAYWSWTWFNQHCWWTKSLFHSNRAEAKTKGWME